MEREVTFTIIGETFDVDVDLKGSAFIEIEDAMNSIINANDMGATHLRCQVDLHLDYACFSTVRIEKESDEDYSKRLAEAEERRLQGERMVEKVERAKYEELKKKYEH